MGCKVAVALALVLEWSYRAEAAALELGCASASHLCDAVKRRTRAHLFGRIRQRPDLGHWHRLIQIGSQVRLKGTIPRRNVDIAAKVN